MSNEWKSNEPAVAADEKPAPGVIACDAENPPVEVLLENAMAIDARLAAAKDGQGR